MDYNYNILTLAHYAFLWHVSNKKNNVRREESVINLYYIKIFHQSLTISN